MSSTSGRLGTTGAVAILALAAMVWGSGRAHAAESTKIGVVDPQTVLEKSRAGKRALETLKEYADTRRKLLAGEEEEIKDLEKQLREQDKTLSEDDKKQKQEKFRAKLQDYQRHVQDFNQQLTVKQKELVDEYMKKISAATKTIAEKGGFALIVDKGSESSIKIVIYNRDALDLTDQVIREFDRQNK